MNPRPPQRGQKVSEIMRFGQETRRLIAQKIRRVRNGERVIVSEREIMAFPYVPRMRTIPNPHQCGILDRWIAYINPEDSRK